MENLMKLPLSINNLIHKLLNQDHDLDMHKV